MRTLRITGVVSAFLVIAVSAIMACAPSAPVAGPTATPTRPAPAPPTATTQPAPKPSPAAEKPLQPPVVVKHGSLAASAGNMGVYIALERGYFKEQGLDVELVPFRTSTEVIPAVATGEIQTAGIAPNAALYNALLRGIKPRFAATVTKQEKTDKSAALVVRKDLSDQGAIKDYSDLKGKAIGVTGVGGGSSYEIAINLALKKGGLTAADARIESLAFPDIITALGGKAIHAAVLQEPLVTQGVEQGVLVPWKWLGEIMPPGLQGMLIMYSPGFASENPEAARRWMVAYLKGARDYRDAFDKGKDKGQVAQIIAKHLALKDPAIVERANPFEIDPNGFIDPAEWAEHIGFSLEKGYIKEKPDIASLVDRQWVEYALQKLGPYK